MTEGPLTPKEGILLDKDGSEIPLDRPNYSTQKGFFRVVSGSGPKWLSVPMIAIGATLMALFAMAFVFLSLILGLVLRLFGLRVPKPRVQVFSGGFRRS